MYGVGAADAFFCDVYADLVSRTLRAKQLAPGVVIPDRLNNLRVPAITVIRPGHDGWRWRMAARELIEKESVLSISEIGSLLNCFCRDGHKVFAENRVGGWIVHGDAKMRCFGITPTEYRALRGGAIRPAREAALKHLKKRFQIIFQRRNDCIHNCDRPKVAVQRISGAAVEKALEDLEFLAARIHEALVNEFPEFLQGLGFAALVRARVLA